MLKNYAKVTLRNILKHRGYSFINITGLSIGMACCIFIMLWVFHELSYDRFHENADTLYRVEEDQHYSGDIYHVTVTPFPIAPAFKEEIPEVIDATRLVWFGTVLLKYKEKAFFENNIRAVDPSFFQMFTFPLIKGDINTVLDDLYSIVISEEVAEKYFGSEEPLGKILSLNNRYDFKVTGVIKKVPDHSSITFNMVVPLEFMRTIGRYNPGWGSNSIVTFLQVRENSSIEQVNKKMTAIVHTHNPRSTTDFLLKPLKRVHLYSHFGYGNEMGDIIYVYIFSAIALFILLIACINFMNLSTARSAKRAREIGMRKVAGAKRGNIIFQFLGESVVLSFIALILAVIVIIVVIPQFNTISGKNISASYIFNVPLLAGLIGIALFTGIIAGSYPAFFLSAFHPVKVFKGRLSSGAGGALFRKLLVVVQFSISIFLILGTGIIFNQVNYMRNKKLGYDKDHLLYIDLKGNTRDYYYTLKNELKRNPAVVNVTGTSEAPTRIGSNSSGAEWDGKDPELKILISQNIVGYDYTETYGIEIKEGRGFSSKFTSDTTGAFLINEELAKIIGKEPIIGERFSFMGVDGKIVGLMKNFHFQPVREEIEPLAVMVGPARFFRAMVIRVRPEDISSSIDFIKNTWARIIPDYPFEYRFFNEDFDRMYRAETRMGTLLRYFTILSVLIACLGLFGLASFTAEQKTKEIGIRKVLGATIPGLVLRLSMEFIKWVMAANIIAWPLAYLLMNKWLQGFAYRTTITPVIFIVTGVVAFFIAIITVSYQSVKAALADPVRSLKYE